MKIKYRHASEPSREKLMDTVKLRSLDNAFMNSIQRQDKSPTQEEYDSWLLKKLEKDKGRGKIICFEPLQD